jgi:hypothetical protein
LRRGGGLLLAVAAAIGGLALWLTLDAQFYVYDAEIAGARRVSYEQVFGASELMGLHVLWARPTVVEARILEGLPSLESAEVKCRLPSDCTIAVVERQPRVLWNEGGDLWWTDEEGAVFPAMGEGTGPGATGDVEGRWLVTGTLPRDNEGNLDGEVRVALTELWKSGLDVPTEFEYGAEYGLSFVNERGWRVIVGEGSGMSERLCILEQVTAHLESSGVTPGFVDVRFPKAPYCSLVGDS